MKTFLSILALSLISVATLHAQCHNQGACVSDANAKSELISETSDCGYWVRQYKVTHTSGTDYTLHFRLNMAEFSSTFDQNSLELNEVSDFVYELRNNKHLNLKHAIVTGYASPDGPEKFNQELAHHRAENFKEFILNKYQIQMPCKVSTRSDVFHWKDCAPMLECRTMPHHDKVMEILNSDHTEQAKEAALSNMPEAWAFLKKEILPQMRRVDLFITFEKGEIITERCKQCDGDWKNSENKSCTSSSMDCKSACEVQKEIDAERRDAQYATDIIENEAHFTGKLAGKEARLEKKATRKAERLVKKLQKEEERLTERKAKADRKAAAKKCK